LVVAIRQADGEDRDTVVARRVCAQDVAVEVTAAYQDDVAIMQFELLADLRGPGRTGPDRNSEGNGRPG
jgi:hypothetical protein